MFEISEVIDRPSKTSAVFQCAPPNQAYADDRELVLGLLGDEADAWRVFSERFSRLIYRCITRITVRFRSVVNQDEIPEIYSIVCLRLLANDKHKLRSFDPERGTQLKSWICMLATQATYDFLRSVKRQPLRTSLSEAESLASEAPDPSEVSTWKERAKLVDAMLEEFSERDREFVELYFIEGLEPQSIAQRMGISVKTVYSKKHKIQNRLESLMIGRRLAA